MPWACQVLLALWLLEKVLFLEDHKDLFQWKIIAWSSAGTNILSKISFSNDYQSITTWLGLLNIWTMCHFTKQWIWKEMLEGNNEKLELFFLEEEEYICIES